MLFGVMPMPRQTLIGSAQSICLGLLVCFLLFGCGDTCFVITGIFPNTTSITNPPTCNLSSGNGTVTVGINTVIASPAIPMSPNLQHVFITLSGIDANPNADAAEDSPDWQALAPDLTSEPVQIDLMDASAPGPSCASRIGGKASVRASAYSQIRLRLLSEQAAADDPLPRINACSRPNFNCVVDRNGNAHALVLKNGARDFIIAPRHITDGSFNVLPGTETHLSIVFDPYSSLAAADGDAVQIAPVFSAETVACGFSPSP
jgi:Domain of unknown function (DUF4382)